MLRRALVTGGSGDIGMAICRRFAPHYHVIIHAHRQRERADVLAHELCQQGYSAEALQFDVTDPDATQAALDGCLTAGPIQVLVNNAGLYDDAVMAGMTREQWRRVIDVNLNGFFHVTQPLLLPMLRTRWGRIINLSSVAAVIGNRGQTNYAAAKAALHGATKALALECASRGVTVNAVAPGIIAGHIAEREFDPALVQQLVPMQRMGTPEEVAALVNFLASEEAGYISGQIININGFMA